MLLTGSASAYTVKESDFIDWDYVLRVWSTKKTRAQGVAEWDRVVPVYKEWAKSHSVMDVEALNQHPQGTLIKQGHDLPLVYDKWIEIYSTWLATLDPKPWNQSTECYVISLMNIFTHQCNDLPDWRTPEGRVRDEKNLADYEARHAEADALRAGKGN